MKTTMKTMLATGILAATILALVPAASADGYVECVSYAAGGYGAESYHELVYDNYMWPGDVVFHATLFVGANGRLASAVLTCPGTIP